MGFYPYSVVQKEDVKDGKAPTADYLQGTIFENQDGLPNTATYLSRPVSESPSGHGPRSMFYYPDWDLDGYFPDSGCQKVI